MFREIFTFEVRYHLKQPLIYICLVIFFLLTFGAVTTDSVTVGGAIGNVNRNAPFVIMQLMLVMSLIGVIPTTAFVASSVHRDFEYNTDALFFSSPLRRGSYLLGRFLGSMTVSMLIYVGVAAAIMIGSFMPWLEKDHIGAFTLVPYIYSFFVLVLPNILLAGAIFFCIAALTRSMMATYSGVVGFFVLYGVASAFLGNLENERLVSLIDPWGFSAFSIVTRYWTVFERNTSVLPLNGVFLWNRVMWLAVAVAVYAFTALRFSFTTGARKSRRRRDEDEADAMPAQLAPLPRVQQSFGGSASFRQYFQSAKLESIAVVKSVPFLVILFLGVFNVVGASLNIDSLFDTAVYPVTHLMLQVIRGAFVLFAVIISAFYAGEIVWRERSIKLSEVHDAMPVPTWVLWAAKLTALLVVTLATLATAAVATMIVQLSRGYHNLEPGLYVNGIAIQAGIFMLLVAALSFLLQTLLNNKYVGFLGMVVYFLSLTALSAMHFEHHLYSYGTTSPREYSDINGFGQFAGPALWFYAYWTFFIIAAFVAGHMLWVRGTETAFARRWSIGRRRFTRQALATLAVALIGFAGTGCYIYYNTNVLNRYVTSDQTEKLTAEYEKLYKRYERIPQPRITAVQADVDIDPAHRSVAIRGTYTLVNKTAAPISDLHVTMNPAIGGKATVSIDGARPTTTDRDHGYTIYRLAQPLAPGASMPLRFTVDVKAHGFVNSNPNTDVIGNGTFISNGAYFPHIGYILFNELQDRSKRKKYGLPPVIRFAKIDDIGARGQSQVSHESDWIQLDTTVSTSPDQIAIAPGYLQKEWIANGRRYFHYKTDAPILGYWSYLSARYQVKRDQWHGVTIEIYYDTKHPYNVDRMIYGVKKSLDYYTANFSPYQFRQVRILEFPRYARFAESFPNTIPFSESIGFIADLRDKEAIDYVLYVTAHEVGHQWWAHQVIGADVQGTTMITETLAQYSALMVMEKEYGPAQMRKFLRFELDRYLGGRGGELVAEMPLNLVENQPYIHYRKGSLAMYALRDAIGEDRVNAALAKFIKDHAFSEPPYTTTIDLLNDFRAVTPPDRQSLIHDLFETITLYDNKTTEASVKKLPNGKYAVHFTVEARKLRASGSGAETAIPVDDWIDIGILGDSRYTKSGKAPSGKAKDDKVLFLEKRHITQPAMTFDLTVDQPPTRVGIDPFNKLIDRNPEDNTKRPSGS